MSGSLPRTRFTVALGGVQWIVLSEGWMRGGCLDRSESIEAAEQLAQERPPSKLIIQNHRESYDRASQVRPQDVGIPTPKATGSLPAMSLAPHATPVTQ